MPEPTRVVEGISFQIIDGIVIRIEQILEGKARVWPSGLHLSLADNWHDLAPWCVMINKSERLEHNPW